MSSDIPVDDLEFDLADLIEAAEAADARLGEWERGFMEDIAGWYKVRGSRMTVSERQAESLRRILRKVG